ncbi:MAG: hypothetical protein ACR2HR_10015 [Euzebya sp.]
MGTAYCSDLILLGRVLNTGGHQHPGRHDLAFLGDRIADWLQWFGATISTPMVGCLACDCRYCQRAPSGTQNTLSNLPVALETALYRVAQESVTNVSRHAQHAPRVQIDVVGNAEDVRLTISDDGSLDVPPVAAPSSSTADLKTPIPALGSNAMTRADRALVAIIIAGLAYGTVIHWVQVADDWRVVPAAGDAANAFAAALAIIDPLLLVGLAYPRTRSSTSILTAAVVSGDLALNLWVWSLVGSPWPLGGLVSPLFGFTVLTVVAAWRLGSARL